MLEGTGKIYRHGNFGFVIYVTQGIAKDSAFPFHHGESVTIEIVQGRKSLFIRKKEAKKQ